MKIIYLKINQKSDQIIKGNLYYLFLLLIVFESCNNQSNSSDMTAANTNEEQIPWWASANVYEVNIRQYTPEGTLKAFQSHLPRLEKMGVEIIWLMPIHPIGVKNRKGSMGSYYSVRDYTSINPDLGNNEDLHALIKDAHARGMKVILDWVANHSAWDNQWVESNPEWYTQDENGEAPIAPINEKGEATDWTDVADLNYDHPGLRRAMTDAMLYWVREYNIDGYRCDFAHWVPVDFWSQATQEIKKLKPDVFLLAECDFAPMISEGGFYADYGWHFHHVLNSLAKGEKSVHDVCTSMDRVHKNFPDHAFKLNFVSNHDENSWAGSVPQRLGDAADPITALAFTIAGIPLIYSGQESSLSRSLAFFEKDEIDWTGQDKSKLFRRLLTLKKKNKALWNGLYGGKANFLRCDNDILVYRRLKDEHEFVALFNFSKEQQFVSFPKSAVGHVPYLSNVSDLHVHVGDQVVLPSLGYALFSTPIE